MGTQKEIGRFAACDDVTSWRNGSGAQGRGLSIYTAVYMDRRWALFLQDHLQEAEEIAEGESTHRTEPMGTTEEGIQRKCEEGRRKSRKLWCHRSQGRHLQEIKNREVDMYQQMLSQMRTLEYLV